MVCLFCSIENDSSQKIILREDFNLFCQNENKQGPLKYSGIIIPIVLRETIFDLTQEEMTDAFKLLQKVRVWMDKEFKPDGYNIGWNCGATAGQKIFHAHMHVIPRFKQEPLAGKGIRSHLKSEINRW